MSKGRLEAFSDGILAIIMTITVLELRPPQSPNLDAIVPLALAEKRWAPGRSSCHNLPPIGGAAN